MGKKRKFRAPHYAGSTAGSTAGSPTTPDGSMGASASSLPPLPPISVPTFTLSAAIASSTRPAAPPPTDGGNSNPDDDDGGGEWQMAKRHKKAKKPRARPGNYPEFKVSPQKIQRKINIADLQSLMLWIVADGVSPQWLLTRHKPEIRRFVVMMVPGLGMDMFDGSLDLNFPVKPREAIEDADGEDAAPPPGKKDLPMSNIDSESFYPSSFSRERLPECLEDLADMFTHIWPCKALGDDRYSRVTSPIQSFLSAPIPKGQQPNTNTPQNKRLKLTDLLMSVDELLEDKYPLHSSQLAARRKALKLVESDEERGVLEQRKKDGWVETDLVRGDDPEIEAGSVLEGKTVYALDCEMCETAAGSELTRISMIDWDGKTVYDTFVKPANAITDYLTAYSGITAAHLENITTTLADVQAHLLTLFTRHTVLVGQSLVSDLAALKLIHPFVVDTSVIYHSSKGPPYKPSLKWLAQRFLKREIQLGSGTPAGHDSVEDALASLDLLKMKLERGSAFGTVEAASESVFRRLARMHPAKSSAVVDYGDPSSGHGAGASRTVKAGSDDEVVEGVLKCAHGDPRGTVNGVVGSDFVWSRLRLLDNARGWNGTTHADAREGGEEFRRALAEAAAATVARIRKVWEGLPPCSAFVVYSGTGDPRRMRRLMEMKRTYKEEYKTKKWDQLSVKWTDDEEQELRRGVMEARSGLAFMCVK